MSRQDQFVTFVSVQLTPGGPLVRIPDPFDTCSGGAVTAADTKHRPGGALNEQSFGGPRTVENVTTSRGWDQARDNDLSKRLMNCVGWAKAQVSKQPTDPQMVPIGAPTTWTGTLIRVTPPPHDSNSASRAMMELEVSTAGSVA
jgi:hypothetical protein